MMRERMLGIDRDWFDLGALVGDERATQIALYPAEKSSRIAPLPTGHFDACR